MEGDEKHRVVMMMETRLIVRSDDNEESLKKRFVTYEQATMPIIKHFEELNLVHKLDATKLVADRDIDFLNLTFPLFRTTDEVYAEVEKILKPLQQ